MTKYLFISYLLILIYSMSASADICDPQFWKIHQEKTLIVF